MIETNNVISIAMIYFLIRMFLWKNFLIFHQFLRYVVVFPTRSKSCGRLEFKYCYVVHPIESMTLNQFDGCVQLHKPVRNFDFVHRFCFKFQLSRIKKMGESCGHMMNSFLLLVFYLNICALQKFKIK